uniref:Uncharacterized protein n=1 Tax=Kalmanozyma brasiliensis (strain GHG001) TaxID=1365824 RepID=V5GTV4_KALBG
MFGNNFAGMFGQQQPQPNAGGGGSGMDTNNMGGINPAMANSLPGTPQTQQQQLNAGNGPVPSTPTTATKPKAPRKKSEKKTTAKSQQAPNQTPMPPQMPPQMVMPGQQGQPGQPGQAPQQQVVPPNWMPSLNPQQQSAVLQRALALAKAQEGSGLTPVHTLMQMGYLFLKASSLPGGSHPSMMPNGGMVLTINEARGIGLIPQQGGQPGGPSAPNVPAQAWPTSRDHASQVSL